MLTHLHSDIFPEAPLCRGSSGSGTPVGRLAKGSRPGPGVTGACTSLSPAVHGRGANIRCAPVGLCPGICGCLPAVRHRGVSDGEPQLHVAAPRCLWRGSSVCLGGSARRLQTSPAAAAEAHFANVGKMVRSPTAVWKYTTAGFAQSTGEKRAADSAHLRR